MFALKSFTPIPTPYVPTRAKIVTQQRHIISFQRSYANKSIPTRLYANNSNDYNPIVDNGVRLLSTVLKNNTMFALNNRLKDYMPPAGESSWFSTYASFVSFIILVRSMADQLLPYKYRSYIYSTLPTYLFADVFSPNVTLVIHKMCGMINNQVYDAAEVYLQTKTSPSIVRRRVSKTPAKKIISVTFDEDEEVTDTYDNVKLRWCFMVPSEKTKAKPYFELTFHKKHNEKVMNSYLPYVLARADAIKQEEKVVKIYTRHYSSEDDGYDWYNPWGSVKLEHPSTFETMAMDPELKRMIVEDLDSFVRRKEFYKKVGKAWKRGYLLYGPPGTGKSSLIAAMANYLKFDVYDLDLISIGSNSQLMKVLLSTTSRSILVIEDIDCCGVNFGNRASDSESDSDSDESDSYSKMTLSGLLNFIDGLWSCSGEERIIVFTTNHKDRLDPALLRPGRMDMHIHMSYCTTGGFKVLASNYLGVRDHRLFGEIESLIESTKVTPAEVAGELLKSNNGDVALGELVNFLKRRKNDEINEKHDEGTNEIEDEEEKKRTTDDNNIVDVQRHGLVGWTRHMN